MQRPGAKTGLDIVLAGDPRMFNPYGIIAVNPKKHPGINYADATKLIEWITSPAGQQVIADFKVNGEQVFFPTSGKAVASGKGARPGAGSGHRRRFQLRMLRQLGRHFADHAT